jgi:hypothetical protein
MDVTVAADPTFPTVTTLYGVGLLGATVDFGSVHERTKALVAPASRLDDYGAGPRTRQVAYGEEHPNPAVAYFERDVWSENPTEPPDYVAADDALLRVDGRTYTHHELLTAARQVVDDYGLDATSEVVVRGPLSHPGVVAAGLVAPLVAGGVVVVPDEYTTGDLGVGAGPDPQTVAPDDVL